LVKNDVVDKTVFSDAKDDGDYKRAYRRGFKVHFDVCRKFKEYKK